LSFEKTIMVNHGTGVSYNIIYTPVEAAEGKMAHSNGWNGVNGMGSTTWKPGLIPFH
jgi:hypothetical protein